MYQRFCIALAEKVEKQCRRPQKQLEQEHQMMANTTSLTDPSNYMPLRRTLRVRLLWVFGLNAAIGLFIAITLWWLQSRGDLHTLPGHLGDSFIHSFIYGTMFGLGMAYLAERLATFRSPWNWISIIASLAVIAVLATMAVQLSL